MKTLLMTLSLILVSCNSDEPSYLFQQVAPQVEQDKRIYPLSLITMDKNIDILFVIDNSFSMNDIQQSVVRNSEIFFKQFASQGFINWKIGIVSTDDSEAPYLGFTQSFDSKLIKANDPNSFNTAVRTFQDAVSALGVNGSGWEFVFYNALRHLERYPFQRPNSHLVIVMVSDEREQSTNKGSQYEGGAFFNLMSKRVSNSKVLRFFGALQATDLKSCSGDFTYKRGNYEKVINLSNGFVVSACEAEFGKELAKIGKNIRELAGVPRLLLRNRPIVETIQVFYKGRELPSGSPDDGGLWYYDENSNTINFHGLDFVGNLQTDHFKIDFEVDNGQRP
jgi:hypothetical protein